MINVEYWKGEIELPDYKIMYYELAAKVADAVELLVSAQQQVERQFIENADQDALVLLSKVEKEENEE